MRSSKIVIMAEGAAMIALSTVLSMIKVYQLPWGGSITLLSMVPICFYSIKRGLATGMVVAFANSLVQMFLSMAKVLSWGLTPGVVIACFMLDYILAYSVLGFAGAFRKKGTKGWIIGTIMATMLRFLMHFFSGAFLWKTIEEIWGFIPANEYLYSLLYNGSYMIPEMVFTTVAVVVLFKLPVVRDMVTSDN